MATTSNTTPNNILVYRGDDFATQLVFADENNCPIDLTGWTIFFTIKKRLEDPDSAALVSENITPSDPTSGIVLVSVSNTVTKAFNGAYWYDFKFINASGAVTTITSGTITFLEHATRRT